MNPCGVVAAGVLTGVASAFAVLLFSLVVDILAGFFQAHVVLVWLIPAAGVVTYALYRGLKMPFSTSTASVLEDVGKGHWVRPAVGPGIFAGTCLTIAAGGSAGKEAAALQMGASIASSVGAVCRVDGPWAARVLAMCGMASALSVLLCAPLAATIFVFELFRTWERGLVELVAVAAAAFIARGLSLAVAADNVACSIAVPEITISFVGGMAAVFVFCCIAGVVFCLLLALGRKASRLLHPLQAVVAAGLVYALVLHMVGDYSIAGTGMEQVSSALSGSADGFFFVEKLLLTALLLSFGIKGGEIMPTLCIGATSGAFFGQLLGVDVAFAAAFGLVVVFSACTNCPFASLSLGVELFGVEGLPFFAVGALVAFVVSSRAGLYSNVGKLSKITSDSFALFRRSKLL